MNILESEEESCFPVKRDFKIRKNNFVQNTKSTNYEYSKSSIKQNTDYRKKQNIWQRLNDNNIHCITSKQIEFKSNQYNTFQFWRNTLPS